MRIERPARALMPAVRIIAPAHAWGLTHAEKVEYARERGIPAAATADAARGAQANLWGRSVPCGALDDPWVEPPADVYALTKHPADCPGTPAYLEIEFEAGVPKAINGVAMSFADIIASVGTIAAAHGVGRIDMVECGADGALSRVVHEAPAAVVLHAAHRELEGVFSPRDLLRVKQDLAVTYAAMVYDGGWHSPLRGAMDAFVAAMQQPVTGTVRTRLFKGSAQVVGRKRAPAHRPALLEKAV
jgi:argininosuccinate synthase